MATILRDMDETNCSSAQVEADDLWLSQDDFATVTGWALKPEGFCKGDVCVPASSAVTVPLLKDDRVNTSGFWRHLGHPVVHDDDAEVWALGASARDRASALQSTEAPDFSLPDLDGNITALSDLRGKKVLLATWASW